MVIFGVAFRWVNLNVMLSFYLLCVDERCFVSIKIHVNFVFGCKSKCGMVVERSGELFRHSEWTFY